jgi:hypothetical protein
MHRSSRGLEGREYVQRHREVMEQGKPRKPKHSMDQSKGSNWQETRLDSGRGQVLKGLECQIAVWVLCRDSERDIEGF